MRSVPTRESFFEKEISTIRKRELKCMSKNAIIKTINISMVFGTPPITACVIFAAYEMMVGRLAATLAFTTLSLFNILRFPLVVLPKVRECAAIIKTSLTDRSSIPLPESGVVFNCGLVIQPASHLALHWDDLITLQASSVYS
jgi:hypothetical protein